jgi:HrpA-like RNA helicase
MTTGVLLQTLISKKSLRDYSHIIVDEVHERDLDTDLLILVMKKLMIQTGDRITKIILMSATLNAEKFADYFPKWKVGGQPSDALIVRIPQTTFHQVHEYYIDGLERPLVSQSQKCGLNY